MFRHTANAWESTLKKVMNDDFQQLMRTATQLTREGRLDEATQAIKRALNSAAPANTPPTQPTPNVNPGNDRATGPVTLDASATVLGGSLFEVDALQYDPAATAYAKAQVDTLNAGEFLSRERASVGAASETDSALGEFTSGFHTHLSQMRRYKLYTPPGQVGRSLPLVVMLHGCTQNPDDFATGTAMNTVALEVGFHVLYPEQSQAANPSRCWNWFKHADQRRDGGEPALIAGMTQAVMQALGVDSHRVFIAGLSAGGAMATIVAEAYPEIFVAVGVHSGLPRGAAENVMEALAVMKSGDSNRAPPATGMRTRRYVPTIVFHGDQDQTVHLRNGEQVIATVIGNAALAGEPAQPFTAGGAEIERGVSSRGRHYTRSIYRDATGKTTAEHWQVHGAGHAWSGGEALGTYTDATGPDATREMLRFFFEQSQRSAH